MNNTIRKPSEIMLSLAGIYGPKAIPTIVQLLYDGKLEGQLPLLIEQRGFKPIGKQIMAEIIAEEQVSKYRGFEIK